MHPRVGRAVALARTVAAEARRHDIGFLAAAVAYYAFVSLVPLALLGFAVGSAVGEGLLTDTVERTAGRLLAPEGQDLLTTALAGEAGRGGASLVGTFVLLWSGSRVLRGLDRAFSRVYGDGEPQGLLDQVRDSMTVLAAALVGIVGMGAVSAVVALLPLVSYLRGVGIATMWATLVVAFLPLYAVFPDEPVGVREALPGAALAGTAFTLLGSAFAIYTSVAGGFAVYGVLGGVLLVVTWLYVGALALMVGAVLNAVLAGRIGGFR